jgi:hypothetical protein
MSLKRRLTCNGLNDVISQATELFTATSVRILNLTIVPLGGLIYIYTRDILSVMHKA